MYQTHLSSEANMLEIAKGKTQKDLFQYAWDFYAFSEEQVRQIMKDNGLKKFKSENWFTYLDTLRAAQDKVEEFRAKRNDNEYAELLEVVAGVEKVVTQDCWHYNDNEEQAAARLRLDELRRQRRVKNTHRMQKHV